METARLAWDALPLHPDDVAMREPWRAEYERKYELARRLRPRRICEIGVRAGYSAWMFLHAVPGAFYLGIDNDSDTHGGRHGMIAHAREILAPYDAAFWIYDSQRLSRLPGTFDPVHVDGDHSASGTLHDLVLGWAAGRLLLVDDFGAIPDVRRAVEWFCAGQGARVERIDGKQALVWRR